MTEPKVFSGEVFREKRIAAGYARPEAFAYVLEKSVYTVLKYEQSVIEPPLAVAARMASLLSCTVDDLLIKGAVA